MERTNPTESQPEQTVSTEAGAPVETPSPEWKSWVIAAAIAAAILLIVVVYRSHTASRIETASRMLGEAKNVEALKAIVTQYPRTPTAQMASLLVAKSQYDAGDYVTASASYSEFLAKNPKHSMAPVAELGKLHCTEALGQTDEALSGYAAFPAKHAGHYLVPLAVFGKARCLEQKGRLDEARVVYEDFLAANPDSEWKADVEEYLQQLGRKMRKPLVRL